MIRENIMEKEGKRIVEGRSNVRDFQSQFNSGGQFSAFNPILEMSIVGSPDATNVTITLGKSFNCFEVTISSSCVYQFADRM